MKSKLIALALVCTSALSVLAGCSNSTIVSTPKTTDRTDIAFVASYDKDNKEIKTTLTNDTSDEIILYDRVYDLYKKVDEDKWEIIKFDYKSTGEANYLFTDDKLNSDDIIYPAYDKVTDGALKAENAKKNGGLEAGEYKITMTFNVYPESEAQTIPHGEDSTVTPDNPDGIYVNAEKAHHEEITVGADFTVE